MPASSSLIPRQIPPGPAPMMPMRRVTAHSVTVMARSGQPTRGLLGEGLLLGRELVDHDVGVAVLVAQVEDVGRDHVAQRVALAQLGVDETRTGAHLPARFGSRRFSGAGSASRRACQSAITSASGGPSRSPGVKVAGRCW